MLNWNPWATPKKRNIDAAPKYRDAEGTVVYTRTLPFKFDSTACLHGYTLLILRKAFIFFKDTTCIFVQIHTCFTVLTALPVIMIVWLMLYDQYIPYTPLPPSLKHPPPVQYHSSFPIPSSNKNPHPPPSPFTPSSVSNRCNRANMGKRSGGFSR